MNRKQRVFYTGIKILMLVLGSYILWYGLKELSSVKLWEDTYAPLQEAAGRLCYPGVYYAEECMGEQETKDLYANVFSRMFPVYAYAQEKEQWLPPEEELEADYEEPDETEPEVEETEALEPKAEEVLEEEPFPAEPIPVQEEEVYAGVEYKEEQLADFAFVKNEFYTVASGTSIGPEVLNGAELSGMDLRIQASNLEPQILIYHTHAQEGFVDSVEGDLSTTIVGVGTYLSELLRSEYGYHVIHNTNVYDLVDGNLDRNQAYSRALADVEEILRQYPSIEVVIDLHRDGVDENLHLVTKVDGEPTAQIMFFNGLSYSARNGPIEYLFNPYIKENLAFSLQMKLMFEKYYPGLARRNYLNSLRYNLHVRPKSLLVEAGAQTNSLEEMKRAMKPLADALYKVLGNGEF